TPFAFDLTSQLNVGRTNTIAVRVDNSRQMNSRWYSGSGIYRHVRLDVREALHIAQHGIFVRTEAVSDGAAKLAMSITAENDREEAVPRLEYATQVFDVGTDGKPVGSAVASFAPVAGEFRQRTS